MFAEETEKHQNDAENPTAVDVVKVDCVANRELCTQQRIQAFPTLRFFKDKQQYGPDYKNDRTTTALMDFVQQKIQLEQKMKDWHPKRRERVMATKEHPGCMVSGYVLVNRVPGNFHLEARSKTHNLNAAMTNLSHIVNHLSFGTPLRKASGLPPPHPVECPSLCADVSPRPRNRTSGRRSANSRHSLKSCRSTATCISTEISTRFGRVAGELAPPARAETLFCSRARSRTTTTARW